MTDVFRQWLFDPTITKAVVALVGLAVLYTIVRLVNRRLAARIKDADSRYRVRKGVTFLGYLTGLLFLASVLSARLSSFTVAFGVAGAGIAFALQEVIASVGGWVAISFGSFFRVGDRVQLGGIKGDVIDVGVLRTTMMECGGWVAGDQYNGRIVRVANSFVFKEPVYNYSGDFPFLWDEVIIGVRHESDHRRAREIITQAVASVVGEYTNIAVASWRDIVRKYRIEDARLEPIIMLNVTSEAFEFTARYVVDYRMRRTTKDRVFASVLDGIADSRGAVILACGTLGVTEAPVLDVRMLSSPTTPRV